MVWRTQTSPMQRNQKTPSPNRIADMFRDGFRPHDVFVPVLDAFGAEGDLQ